MVTSPVINLILKRLSYAGIYITCIVSVCVASADGRRLTVTQAAEAWIQNISPQAMQHSSGPEIHPTDLLNIIARHGHSLPDHIKSELESSGFNFSRDFVTTDRPQNLDQSLDQGLFRFHYALTGTDAVDNTDLSSNGVPDYVDSVMAMFAKIGSVDFDSLGYSLPPSDDWYTGQYNGGSGHYDVYMFNLSAGYYGYVQGENYAQSDNIVNRGNNENSDAVEQNAMVSFMAIRNNYSSFSGNELENLKVTSAHEFFHAIQYGYDGWEFGWVKEATAVWMEEYIYDEINDCYQYLSEFLENTYDPFNYDTDHGYGSYIYFSYITENWAPDSFIKNYWENAISHNSWDQDYSIQTLNQTMEEAGLDFTSVTQNFHIANGLLSSDPSFEIYAYEEADSFPMSEPSFAEIIVLAEDDTTIEISSWMGSFASEYFLILVEDSSIVETGSGDCCIQVDLYSDYAADTNVAAYLTTITSGDNSMGAIFTSNSQQIERADADSLILVVSGFNSNYDIVSEYGDVEFHDVDYQISITLPTLLETPKAEPIPENFSLHQNFPNPFNGQTIIGYSLGFQSNVKIDIFDLNGRIVSTLLNETKPAGIHQAMWNGRNRRGTLESSGTYFYRIQASDYINTHKLLYIK